jgi:hypothetical protein
VNHAALKKSIQLPRFPQKSLFKMNSDRIDRRRTELEIWLNEVIKSESLNKYILSFFNVDNPSSTMKKLDGSDHLSTFISNMTSSSNNKINTLEKFSSSFFNKKLHLKSPELKILIESLLPLCGDELIGNKSLDFLFRLTTSDFHRDFIQARSQIVGFPAELLKEMCLNEYLTKKRFADSQIQAYHLSKVIQTAAGSSFLYEVVSFKQLNHDKEAIQVFTTWGVKTPTQSKQEVSIIQDWRPLISLPDRHLSFRFVGRELDIFGFLVVQSSIEKAIETLTDPNERKKWDLRMQEMIRIPKESGFIIIYAAERKLYEFHTDVSIEKNELEGKVEFSTKCFQFKRKNTILGNLSSCYKIEKIDLNVKITWNAHFCQNSFNLVREDIFQEANVLQKSFERLIRILESKDDEVDGIRVDDGLLEKFERKKLTKTFSLESFKFLK